MAAKIALLSYFQQLVVASGAGGQDTQGSLRVPLRTVAINDRGRLLQRQIVIAPLSGETIWRFTDYKDPSLVLAYMLEDGSLPVHALVDSGQSATARASNTVSSASLSRRRRILPTDIEKDPTPVDPNPTDPQPSDPLPTDPIPTDTNLPTGTNRRWYPRGDLCNYAPMSLTNRWMLVNPTLATDVGETSSVPNRATAVAGTGGWVNGFIYELYVYNNSADTPATVVLTSIEK